MVGIVVLVGEDGREGRKMDGVNVGDGGNWARFKTAGVAGSGEAAQAEHRKPRSRKMP